MGAVVDHECGKCGVCCKLFLINLNEEEYKSGFYRTEHEGFGVVNDFYEAEEWGANILAQKDDGSCFYLHEERCLIHGKRPQACKDFFCCSEDKKFSKMIERIDNNRE